ncbi:DUF4833 domain-containing protein [Pedobacter sp. JY14-1]|uniref:DUF4833 domain-containing protein n=1 Tax=Pedobacter sp. JY14-1 TaxID=3034151 RepID=UPI0023E10C29|nr:DUF4833 domain-containing protein [Pedobacter sp. JY14-1]
MYKNYFLFFMLLCAVPVLAQVTDGSDPSPLKFPVPKAAANQLFYLQRDPNTNTVIYELNIGGDGKTDNGQPVKAYWIRYADGGKHQDLSYIQRKFAYGVQTKKLGDDHYEVRLVSHKKLPIYVQRSVLDKKMHAYVTVNNKKLRIDRVFVRIEGGSFWLPNVHYVEISGYLGDTETAVTERIKV